MLRALPRAAVVAVALATTMCAAEAARYGNPSGCAGTPAVAPYLLYDGAQLITAAGWACVVTPVEAKMRGKCSGGIAIAGSGNAFDHDGSFVVSFRVVVIFHRIAKQKRDDQWGC